MSPPRRRSSSRGERVAAESLPIARVAVDVSLPHLDRPFDYLVEAAQSDSARPGVRVRVRFAGQLVGGYVLERLDSSEHEGRLAFLERVVSAEVVLSPEIRALARYVADRWGGSMADVLRLAVPPRHAGAESKVTEAAVSPLSPPSHGLSRYVAGDELIESWTAGASPRLVWPTLPGDWPGEIAVATRAVLSSGRGVVIVVPDHRDIGRVDAALTAALGAGHHVALNAELGPAERYRRFLALSRGLVRCVVGTRSAVWAPVPDLGAVLVWDDGDDLHAEPRAPYSHARDVAVARAHLAGASLVLAGFAVTAEGAALVRSGWANLVEPASDARTRAIPRVRATDDDASLDRDPLARAARLPSLAWRTAKDALAAGAPVLVQVPRRGYQPSLACDRCRAPARCAACAGPLARGVADQPPACRWCGVVAAGWRCRECGGDVLRPSVVGSRRTAEELGRAFPGVPVRTSAAGSVLTDVPARPALVVATPGAEPVAADGYGAALLLDAWALLSRADMRAGEEALRRWLNAAALVRGGPDGGRVVIVSSGELRPVQALLRWQPMWHAERELDDRATLHLPPAARIAALTGSAAAVQEMLELAELPAVAELLGPVPVITDEAALMHERMLIRVPRRDGAQLAERLRQAAGVRSARKAGEPVRVELDPLEIG
ncbi:MAG TPA: primosomal protein N' [Mycobacteriales bacterium]|nr:primosomal protein N' [Mycobacteriales bacterium]